VVVYESGNDIKNPVFMLVSGVCTVYCRVLEQWRKEEEEGWQQEFFRRGIFWCFFVSFFVGINGQRAKNIFCKSAKKKFA